MMKVSESMLMTVVLHGPHLSTIYIFWKDIKDIIRGLFSLDNKQGFFLIKDNSFDDPHNCWNHLGRTNRVLIWR